MSREFGVLITCDRCGKRRFVPRINAALEMDEDDGLPDLCPSCIIIEDYELLYKRCSEDV